MYFWSRFIFDSSNEIRRLTSDKLLTEQSHVDIPYALVIAIFIDEPNLSKVDSIFNNYSSSNVSYDIFAIYSRFNSVISCIIRNNLHFPICMVHLFLPRMVNYSIVYQT